MSPLDVIPAPYRIAALACVVAAACAGSFAAGWGVNGWRLGAQVERDNATRAEAAARDLKAATDERDALAGKLAASAGERQKELRSLQDENDRLRRAVATGVVRVRVPGAVCPDVPKAPGGRVVDSGAGAVLTPDAGQTVYDLRAAAGRIGIKLNACQDALKLLSPS